jgi:class 3 adenylate cyclase
MRGFRRLRTRLFVFLILPALVFLGGAGVLGYVYIRQALLEQWREAAILRMERAAHQMDMRLQKTKDWLQLLVAAGNSPEGAKTQAWILEQLRHQPGVSQVKLTWREDVKQRPAPTPIVRLSPVHYFYPEGEQTVGLRSDIKDPRGNVLGSLEVLLKFDYLMKDIVSSGWMQSNMACLVSQEGLYLAHSNPAMQPRQSLGESKDPLEFEILAAMQEKLYGTYQGLGLTPSRVIGFYRLDEAPWAIMLHAPGSTILKPILTFRNYYALGLAVCLAIILVLMRLGLGPTVAAIRNIAHRAREVARGQYGDPLPVNRRDEIGLLTQSFDDMVAGLKERDFISNTFGRYVDPEIARELLNRPEAARLGGEKREVIIMFADVRDFTPLAETLSPEATIHLVNRHFSRMIEVIQQHRGIIVDFLGDAILTFFDPLDRPLEHMAKQAVHCALMMQKALAAENASEPNAPPLYMGIGLHAGKVVVGNIGSESRAKYGIIGAAVNLTHRIQGQAQKGEVVISDSVFHHVETGVAASKTFEAELKGIAQQVTLYVLESQSEEL